MRAFFGKAFAGVIHAAAKTVAPRYVPPTLLPDGEALAVDMVKAFSDAIILGKSLTKDLLEHGVKKGVMDRKAAPNQKSLTKKEVLANIVKTSERFSKICKEGDPDAIGAALVRDFCLGIPHMDKLDNQRRIVAVWSAILLPCVVAREKFGLEITEELIVDRGLQWVKNGYTEDAKRIDADRDTRSYSAHPARIYELISDSAHQLQVDHKELMRSLVQPVISSIGYHIGACEIAKKKSD